jgi:hypothetical protein
VKEPAAVGGANPFVYPRPLAACDVIDREAETERLLALAAGGHYVRLYAPRRYGKTSLLLKALGEAERRARMVPVLVDLYGSSRWPTSPSGSSAPTQRS